jgi:hypothetical protein
MIQQRQKKAIEAKRGTKKEGKEAYFWVDKKLIFHLPTLPEPC